MTRAVWAFLAFNIYSVFLLSAFTYSIPRLLDMELPSETLSAVEHFEIRTWAWGDHYIWRLFSGVVVTAIVAFLAGAISPQKGGKVAAIANIPGILIFWFLFLADFLFQPFGATPRVPGHTGFVAVSLIAIPLTTWVAYIFGKVGAETQTSNFTENTVLGIRPYHWAWIVFPLYLYSFFIIDSLAKWFTQEYHLWKDISMTRSIISLLAVIPVCVGIAPIVMAYNVLKGKSLIGRSPRIKALANTGIIIGGFLLALAIQKACYWLKDELMFWWYG